MHREWLLNKLRVHTPRDAHEAAMAEALRQFVVNHANCFERSLRIGHITGSAWIVDRGRTHALLTHHRKLNKWLQLGGHADGDPDILYSNGDAFDYAPANSRPWHGVQWLENRGQLLVYLRLLDVPVPSVYGPTADENPFAAMSAAGSR